MKDGIYQYDKLYSIFLSLYDIILKYNDIKKFNKVIFYEKSCTFRCKCDNV